MKFRFLSMLFLVCLQMACSTAEVNENSPEDVFKDAEESINDKKYLIALDKLKGVKNKFPYSHYATLAQLRIADVHFYEEQFTDAASAYENFRDLHPKHEKADYVTFQIGESYFNQLPSTEDRDLSPATKAIEAYEQLATLFPKSGFLEKAKEHLKESNERLSEKERYIGDYYYKRDMYDSAAKRYEKITSKYPGSTHTEYAYRRWAVSLIQLSNDAEKPEDKDNFVKQVRSVYSSYLANFPNGQYADEAKDFVQK